ncbi:uncharacterized protein LOC131163739 [Malania oleifera]|uniref:uncharacterized protein LOC131163739 n=1 Tax=Malania oleifera TaxID=397392 RepID=UPI0025AE0614|nr:uncharacterized protein LOC131163739 [Malania oleifera]
MVRHSIPDLHAHDFFQVPGSSCSLSNLSEPPDIRNWFSSYVYESPELDTTDNPGSFLGGTESQKEGFEVEESKKEENENFEEFKETRNSDELSVDEKRASGPVSDDMQEDLSAEVLGSYPLPLPSEPPDIRNWFSSYAYESPLLDICKDFGCSVPREGECKKDGLSVRDSHREKENNLEVLITNKKEDELFFGEKIASSRFVRCERSVRDDQIGTELLDKGAVGFEGKKNLSGQINLCSENISGQCLETKALQNYDFTSSLYNENNLWEKDAKSSRKRNPVLITDVKSHIESPKKLLNKRGWIEEASEVKTHMERVNTIFPVDYMDENLVVGISGRKTRRSSDKENGGQALAENSFISTRKGKSMGGNEIKSLKRLENVEFEPLRNTGAVSSAGEKINAVPRKVLLETTNFQHTDELEIAGKWRCPQKGKPNLGPPLKQLRLERWINRV